MNRPESLEELTHDASGWLWQKLHNGHVQVTSAEAESVVKAKAWLARLNDGTLVVQENSEPEVD